MSYDFCIAIDTGGAEPHYIEPYFSDAHPALGRDGMAGNVIVTATGYGRCGNYTSNVSGMWSRCLTAALDHVPDARVWIGEDDRCSREQNPSWWGDRPIATDRLCLRDLNGKSAADLIPLLTAAVAWGIDHLSELHESDPVNGWGDADGAVTYLWDIQRMCEQHPAGRLEISS